MRRWRGLVATTLLVLAWAPPASAAPTQRLAVLELSGAFERDILSVFSDQVRQGALNSLKGTSYEVMTRENMAMLARNMGIDLAACQEGAECEVDIGRNVGAALVLSGSVTKVGSSLVATLKLHGTEAGTLLSSRTAKATDEMNMLDELTRESALLIREGLGLGRRGRSSAPASSGGAVRGDDNDFDMGVASEALVRFKSNPRGAAVLVDGSMLCKETPCSKRLPLGNYSVEMQAEQHHRATRSVTLGADGATVSLSLKPAFGPGADPRRQVPGHEPHQ
jgi:TolB-like protein